jgi:hypothetical protein
MTRYQLETDIALSFLLFYALFFLIGLSNNTQMKYKHIIVRRSTQTLALLALAVIMHACSEAPDIKAIQYGMVFMGGRVIDPESGYDQLANVAISGNKIAAISKLPLIGIDSIDASGLVISPGFIDLHSHALSRLGQQLQPMDGVTTALELEAGGISD